MEKGLAILAQDTFLNDATKAWNKVPLNIKQIDSLFTANINFLQEIKIIIQMIFLSRLLYFRVAFSVFPIIKIIYKINFDIIGKIAGIIG